MHLFRCPNGLGPLFSVLFFRHHFLSPFSVTIFCPFCVSLSRCIILIYLLFLYLSLPLFPSVYISLYLHLSLYLFPSYYVSRSFLSSYFVSLSLLKYLSFLCLSLSFSLYLFPLLLRIYGRFHACFIYEFR